MKFTAPVSGLLYDATGFVSQNLTRIHFPFEKAFVDPWWI